MCPRRRRTAVLVVGFVAFVATALPAVSQEQTVGLFLNTDEAFDGFTLFATASRTSPYITYLIDNGGRVVHSWASNYEPVMAYLLENGHLLRHGVLVNVHPNWISAAGRAGRLEEFDWDGNLVWEFEYSSADHISHHDIEPLPNGNVLMIAWDYRTRSEAIANGRNPATIGSAMWPNHVIEVMPTPPSGGEIVWERHLWDHMIQDFDPTKLNFGNVADHPERMDINHFLPGWAADWSHCNGLDYNPDLDQILISCRHFSEFAIIDHSTTTEEASGHTGGTSGMGGDFLYRWGNPRAYRRGAAADQKMFVQHDATWIPPGYPGAGNILVFNNGAGRPGVDYSSVDEIETPVDENGLYSIDPGEPFDPLAFEWSYSSVPPEDFFSQFISGAERQPNGTTLICEGGSGRFFEVTADKRVVWEYVNPVTVSGTLTQGQPILSSNDVFKVRRYARDYPAFDGRDLTPGDPVEIFDAPYPVPGGSLSASRLTPEGDEILVEWDATTCTSYDYKLIYGRLDRVAQLEILSAECGIGLSGSYTWTGATEDALFFLVVGTDDSGIYESSWGLESSRVERAGTFASFTCGATTKIVTSTCP